MKLPRSPSLAKFEDPDVQCCSEIHVLTYKPWWFYLKSNVYRISLAHDDTIRSRVSKVPSLELYSFHFVSSIFYSLHECARKKNYLCTFSPTNCALVPKERSFRRDDVRAYLALAVFLLARFAAALAFIYQRLPTPSLHPSYTHPLVSQYHPTQRLFSLTTCDTCDTHHIHSLTCLITHDTGLYSKNTLRDISCLTVADTAVAEEATAEVAVVAEEDTVAGKTITETADTARRTTIPMGMP
jgi:hypothetical protein